MVSKGTQFLNMYIFEEAENVFIHFCYGAYFAQYFKNYKVY